jgi:hypothetical protein
VKFTDSAGSTNLQSSQQHGTQSYSGGRTVKAMSKFLQHKLNPDFVDQFQNEELWENNGNVLHVGDDHWEWVRSQQPIVFAFFYAPVSLIMYCDVQIFF